MRRTDQADAGEERQEAERCDAILPSQAGAGPSDSGSRPGKGPSSPRRGLLVRNADIGGGENAASFAYPPPEGFD